MNIELFCESGHRNRPGGMKPSNLQNIRDGQGVISSFSTGRPAHRNSTCEMGPSFAGNYVVYSRSVNAKFFCKNTAWAFLPHVAIPNLQHLSFCQFAVRVLLSFPIIKLSLMRSVLQIIFGCAQPEVIKIHANNIVSTGTVVKNLKPIWNRSLVNHPRTPMGLDVPSKRTSPGNATVTTSESTSRPKPAGIGLVHLGPESLWKILTQMLRSQILRCNLDHHSSVCAARVTGPAALLFSHNAA